MKQSSSEDLRLGFQAGFEFFVQVTEGPVAEDADDVARLAMFREMIADLIRIVVVVAITFGAANIIDQLFGV